MALHEQCVGATDEWYTPAYVFEAMDVCFATDVASPGAHVTPWIPAERFITVSNPDVDWRGFVWMNPPFGGRNALVPWLERFMAHGNGVALVPDRTSAPWWQHYAPLADVCLFVAKKIRFIGADGKPGGSPAQGTTLLAVGVSGRQALRNAEAAGLGLRFYRPEASPRSEPAPQADEAQKTPPNPSSTPSQERAA